MAGKKTLEELKVQDMNNDSTLDIMDVRLLLQAYINKDKPIEIKTDESGTTEHEEKITVEKIHFIKLGYKADAILIESDGKFAMIDTGIDKTISQNNIKKYLNKLGVKKLEFLLLTHSHSDHIGGVDMLIDNFSIGTVYMKKPPTKEQADVDKTGEVHKERVMTITNVNKKVVAKGINFKYLTENDDRMTFNLGNMTITFYNTKQRYSEKTYIGSDGHYSYNEAVFSPTFGSKYSSSGAGCWRNDNSICTLIEYSDKKHSALLMGDMDNCNLSRSVINMAQNKIEKDFGSGNYLDIYKIGHHGLGGFVNNEGKRGVLKNPLAVHARYLVATNNVEPFADKGKYATSTSSSGLLNFGDGKKPFTFTLLEFNGKIATKNNIHFVEDTSQDAIVYDLSNEKIQVIK